MAVTGKLKALNVAREKRPGTYGDGGGLYLQVAKGGSKSWIFRFWVAQRDPVTGEPLRDPTTKKLKGRAREILADHRRFTGFSFMNAQKSLPYDFCRTFAAADSQT
jgi:Arm domain-containing DNA-binding protein